MTVTMRLTMPTRLGKWSDKNRWVYWIVRRRSCNGKAHYRWSWQWSCRRRVGQFSKLNETEMIPFTIFLCWAFYVLTLLLLKVTFKRYKISQCLLTHHGFPLESLFLFLSLRVWLFIQKKYAPIPSKCPLNYSPVIDRKVCKITSNHYLDPMFVTVWFKEKK